MNCPLCQDECVEGYLNIWCPKQPYSHGARGHFDRQLNSDNSIHNDTYHIDDYAVVHNYEYNKIFVSAGKRGDNFWNCIARVPPFLIESEDHLRRKLKTILVFS